MLSKLHLNQQRRHPFPVALLVLSIFFFVSCVPAEPAQVPATISLVSPTLTPASPSLEVELSSPLPSVTARGPDLVASDPATVKLASGDLQLIEFIRFT